MNNPEICIGLIFDKGGTPISSFGINDTVNAGLLSGITHAVDSFSKYLAQSFPNMFFNNEDRIHENCLNSGFYFSHFKNACDNGNYGIIFRPLNDFFASSWIKKILKSMVERLESSDNILDSSIMMFRAFNAILVNELKLIEKIKYRDFEEKEGSLLIFRESGVSNGQININIKNILNFIISDIERCIEMKFYTSENVFCIQRREIDGECYYIIGAHKGD